MSIVGTALSGAASALSPSGTATTVKIGAFKANDYSGTAQKTFTSKVNPKYIKILSETEYFQEQAIGTSNASPKFKRSLPSLLSINFTFDNTMDTQDAALVLAGMPGSLTQSTIVKQIEDFKKVVYNYIGTIHQPYFLEITWGDFIFKGQIKSMTVNYTQFNPDGEVLKAEVDTTFIHVLSPSTITSLENSSSPDLTHFYIVKEGDSLPLIAEQTYGDPSFYVKLAKINKLNSFRILEAGTRLILPPLDK